ncbi:chromatin-remodeling factor CHD3, putative [Medicago truncatula]|uniref:Chromatin-remodeling factor CHD3, putative n=1 Tax=Medicago truncatula TaxID=3880 RepID=G7J9N3_MEDTR|nr:chromatin-remodeling factor CHD3, putative [Medicago truncatula]
MIHYFDNYNCGLFFFYQHFLFLCDKQLLESSGKLHLLDKMMVKLKEQKCHYERIDGKVGGAERQIRIDRF